MSSPIPPSTDPIGTKPSSQPQGPSQPMTPPARQTAAAPSVDDLLSPLPPINIVMGDDYPSPDDPDDKKKAYVNSLKILTETDALSRFKQSTHAILVSEGRQWIAWKSSRREWEEMPLADSDIRVTVNYIKPILRSRVQRLTSSEVSWRAVPEDNSYQARDRAKLAINFLKARWRLTSMEQRIRTALMQASATGIVALKSFWNPSIGPLTPATMYFPQPVVDPQTGQSVLDPMGQPVMQQVQSFVDAAGQPVTDVSQAFHYRPGDTDTSIRTVFNLRINPEAIGWTEAEGFRWLLDTEVVPLVVAKLRYPKFAQQIRPMDQPESSLTYERMARGASILKPGQVFQTTPIAQGNKQLDPSQLTTIREYWEMRSAYFPGGRLIAIAGGVVVYDGPWPQGIFPYTPIFGEPGVMTPYGRSVVIDMWPPQQVINREWTAIAKQSGADGVAQWIAWAAPGVPDQIPRDDYAVVSIPMRGMLASRPIGDIIQRMPQGQVSPDRWRMIQEAKATIFDIGAYHEVSRGQIPPGLDSGVAIQYLLEQEGAQLKDAMDALKSSLILWARQQLAIATWGYGTSPRWIPVDRQDLGYMIQTVHGPDLPDPDTLGLDIEYFRPQSDAATRAEVKDLLGMGMIDPRKGLEIMDLGAGFEQAYESETRHYAKARYENLDFQLGNFAIIPVEVPAQSEPPQEQPNAPQQPGQPAQPAPQAPPAVEEMPQIIHPPTPDAPQGRPFLLPEEDDHLIHLDVHAEIALDETQPWSVRQIVLQHMAEHRAVLASMAAQAQQAIPLEGTPGTNRMPPVAPGAPSNE